MLCLGERSEPSSQQSDRITVQSARGSYPVIVQEHAGPWIAHEVTTRLRGSKVVVISDETVFSQHGAAFQSVLGDTLSLSTLCVPPGEPSKSWESVINLTEALLNQGLTRKDMLVAFGGGVVGDLCGFVASIALRGVDWIQVPTTTLAVVDSSVGGKTGINTTQGKNLLGSFYAPNAVLVATQYLATQARPQHSAGLVEAVKMAAPRPMKDF